MFAYCTNNPSNSIDIAGCISISIWPQLFKDLRYGFIHAIVAYHIVSASSFGNIDLAAECWILKGDTFVGRADVIDTATGEVWEIKTKRQESTAAKQAEKYKGGTAVRTNTVIKELGHAGAFSGAFHINMGNYSYDVSYWTPSAGTIVYSVSNAKALQPDARAVYIPKEQHAQETGKAIIGVAAVAFVIYEAFKWGAAVAAAVPTGGTSIGIAAAMP